MNALAIVFTISLIIGIVILIWQNTNSGKREMGQTD